MASNTSRASLNNGGPSNEASGATQNLFTEDIPAFQFPTDIFCQSYALLSPTNPLPSYESMRHPSGNNYADNSNSSSLNHDISSDFTTYDVAALQNSYNSHGQETVHSPSVADDCITGKIIPNSDLASLFNTNQSSLLGSQISGIIPVAEEHYLLESNSQSSSIGGLLGHLNDKLEAGNVSTAITSSALVLQEDFMAQSSSLVAFPKKERQESGKLEMKVEAFEDFTENGQCERLSPASQHSVSSCYGTSPSQYSHHMGTETTESPVVSESARSLGLGQMHAGNISQILRTVKSGNVPASLFSGQNPIFIVSNRETLDCKDATGAVASLVSPVYYNNSSISGNVDRNSGVVGRQAKLVTLKNPSTENVARMAEGNAALPHSTSKRPCRTNSQSEQQNLCNEDQFSQSAKHMSGHMQTLQVQLQQQQNLHYRLTQLEEQISNPNFHPQQTHEMQQQPHNELVNPTMKASHQISPPQRLQQLTLAADCDYITLSSDNLHHHQLILSPRPNQQQIERKCYGREAPTSAPLKMLDNTGAAVAIGPLRRSKGFKRSSSEVERNINYNLPGPYGNSSRQDLNGSAVNTNSSSANGDVPIGHLSMAGENVGGLGAAGLANATPLNCRPAVQTSVVELSNNSPTSLDQSFQNLPPQQIVYNHDVCDAITPSLLKQDHMLNNNNQCGVNANPGTAPNSRKVSNGKKSGKGSRSATVRTTSLAYKCGHCGLQFQTRMLLRKHLQADHSELMHQDKYRVVVCKCAVPRCGFVSHERAQFDAHMKEHLLQGYTPTGKKRQSSAPLQRHRYSKEEMHCPQCEYKCVQDKAFKRHMELHAENKPITCFASCVICGVDFPQESEARLHMNITHRCPSNPDHWQCPMCGFHSVQEKKMIQHIRMHTGTKPHLCTFCDYRSGRRDNLRSHVRRMHKAENLFADSFQPSAALDAEEHFLGMQRANDDQSEIDNEETDGAYRAVGAENAMSGNSMRNVAVGDPHPILGLANNPQDFEIDSSLVNLPYGVMENYPLGSSNMENMMNDLVNQPGAFESHMLQSPQMNGYLTWTSHEHQHHNSLPMQPSSDGQNLNSTESSSMDANESHIIFTMSQHS